MPEVKPVPDEFPTCSPYLIVKGGDQAIAFYTQVFGAKERTRMPGPGGGVGHAELEIGTSLIMLADEMPEMGIVGPGSIGGTPVTLHVYVEKVDAVFAKALELGAKQERPVENQFYGDRMGVLVDPFGHRWSVASRVENLSREELERRAAEKAKEFGKSAK